MKPDLSRSDQVVARVVAWHNSHPLARKISADQVHSVGVVSLPFAVRGARVAPISLALPTAPAPAEPVVIEVPPAPPAMALPAADGEFDTEVDLVVDPPAEAPPVLAEATQAGMPTAGAAPAADALPRVTVVAKRAAQLPARPRPWHPSTWWQRLRGRPIFRPLFSEDFIAPLRPRQVARWAAAHGVGTRPLEPQAQERLIMLDTARRRDGDDAPQVDLYLITAAIGAGDERKRLLLAPGSSGLVWGPRYWDRPRVAAAAGTSLALLAALVTGLVWQSEKIELLALLRPGKAEAAASAPLAASTPASASRRAVHPASAPTQLAAAASGAASAAASAPTVKADASDDAASVPQAVALAASVPASSVASANTVSAEPAPTVASAEQPAAPAEPPSRPESVRPRRGRITLEPLVPRLADGDRQALRAEARLLRGPAATAAESKAKAWALVTRPIDDRRQSERQAAQMQAVALLQPVPMRAELMPAGRGWRAAVWPFQTAKDAEKVRLALADKGLRTELVEF